MTTNVTYRDTGAVVPISTTIKGAPLSNAEIDGNIKSLVDSVDAKVDSSDLAATGGAASGANITGISRPWRITSVGAHQIT